MKLRILTGKQNAVLWGLIASLALSACKAKTAGFGNGDLRMWYVALNEAPHKKPTPFENVTFLEAIPTNRTYRVVGLISPPDGKFKSYAQAINCLRAAAALHGADAVFLDEGDDIQSRGFRGGYMDTQPGKPKVMRLSVRAKAIVWE
jgi:hypothetical protein